MTTTLRPTGPEEHAGNTRLRPYAICVNGRTAGAVRLAAQDRHGVRTGIIEDLTVQPADRRRGRATVASLAAEEILRGWGCRRIGVTLLEGDPGTARLAAALGYTPESSHLLKDLTAPPPLPAGSLLRPLSAEDFPAWLAADRREMARRLAGEGATPEQANEAFDRDLNALLPDGPATDGMVMRVLEDPHGARAGTVWVQVDGSPRPDADAWVYSVKVDEGLRGKGHGRTLMLAAEREALAAGAAVLGLNVHSDNTVAERLYLTLGYRRVQSNLTKPLV